MRNEVDFSKVLLKLLGGEIGEKDSAHAGAVGGKTAADVQINRHDPVNLGPGDVDDILAVESGDREGFSEGRGHALEDRLCGA